MASSLMATTSILQLACPTCDFGIEVEFEIYPECETEVISLRTWCFDPISREQAYELLMDWGAAQSEKRTEAQWER